MSFNKYTTFLVSGMLITGACNTLLNKLQDKQCVKDCNTNNPKLFEQPVLQTLNMFMGEACCLIASYIIEYYSRKKYARIDSDENIPPNNEVYYNYSDTENINTDKSSQPENNINIYNSEPETDTIVSESINKTVLYGKSTLLLWLPSILDICGTTLMNVGLIYVAASVYQMLRGAVVIFTGFFSVVFLKRKLNSSQWISLVLVMMGVSIVGMSNIITKSHQSPLPINEENESVNPFKHATSKNILGVLMVILAQIFTALQFIIEEKIMSRYEISPLKTVGYEGSFGLFTVLAAIPFLYLFIGRYHQGGFFDIPDGFSQIINSNSILVISIGCIFSIAFFNWFGLSVTNVVSATSRSTIDTCRTVLIWMISLYLGWETFNWFQVLGFIVLIYGTFIFNGIINLPFQLVGKNDRDRDTYNENRPLLDENPSSISDDEENENHFANI
ncbi:integral membrane protein [Piromyces finnis]|uniref:Integral membrane protein n=1 Tax=Piromyces finnis TaxID=1754191 RepID=A0A1Y1VHE3_9FUNG|nr:integral membrane protein [Piromyces finnis]|eukprot:ORX54880.1 integral membrane protein [Piromyces finnis]